MKYDLVNYCSWSSAFDRAFRWAGNTGLKAYVRGFKHQDRWLYGVYLSGSREEL